MIIVFLYLIYFIIQTKCIKVDWSYTHRFLPAALVESLREDNKIIYFFNPLAYFACFTCALHSNDWSTCHTVTNQIAEHTARCLYKNVKSIILLFSSMKTDCIFPYKKNLISLQKYNTSKRKSFLRNYDLCVTLKCDKKIFNGKKL